MQTSRVAGRQTVTNWNLATVSKSLATTEIAEVNVTCTVEAASANMYVSYLKIPHLKHGFC